MAAASATGVIAVRLSGNARSMGAAASRVGRAAPTGIARRASRRVVAAAGADRCVAGKAHAREERVVAVGATPFGFASASLARTFCHRLSRGASFAAAASSGGADAGDDDDDAPVHLTEEEREALDTEAAAMASSWASELSAAAWDDADSAETSDFSTDKKKKTRDKSLRAAVANESYDEDDDDFEENYYDYDADDVEPGYEPFSSSASDADAGDGVDPLTKAKRRRKTRREWGKLPDEKLPRVAIVGRPNVGKSALFNRLTGTKRAIVYDQPGITRDRMYVRAFWGDTEFMMVDTGGLESLPGSPQDAPSVDTVGGVEILPGMVESQAALAVREAAALVFVVDGQRGLTAADEEIYGWIRKFHSKTPLMLAVNKCESTTKGEEQILDFWSLGGVEPLAVSAISGTGTGELMDALVRSLPAPELDEKDAEGRFSEEDDAPLKIAIVGRPNVGKSSLLNQLAGDARAIVSDYSGTTRDTIDSDVTGADGNKYTLIDTAGIRRRTAVAAGRDVPESLAVGRALQAMRRADIVVLVVDAEEGPSQQDFVLAERAATQEGCGLVLCVNKWDLIDKDSYSMNEYTKTLRSKLRVFEWASVVYTSALTGQRIQKVLQAANEASVHHRKRLSTATLNAVVQEASLWKSPPSKGGRKGKIYYVTQASTRPPTFVFFVNEPKLFPETYRRYMERSLRENIGFPGSPVRILWRGKGVGKKP
jgi:GTP-binding protein